MTEITDVFIKIGATILAACITYLLKEAVRYIKEASEKNSRDRFINELVLAAEQMLREEDPSGSARLGYVQQMLIEAGYELTDSLRASIEASVYKLNAREAE